MRRKTYWLIAMTMAGCAAAMTVSAKEMTEAQSEIIQDGPLYDESVAGWHIAVEDVQMSDSLENVSVSLGYTGIDTSSFKQEAADGNTFCLIKLLIEKEGSKEVIDWENMLLLDQDDAEYTRIDDAFLTDLGMKRMPGTSLNFGSNEGWIAYEVPEDAEALAICYEFTEDDFICELMD